MGLQLETRLENNIIPFIERRLIWRFCKGFDIPGCGTTKWINQFSFFFFNFKKLEYLFSVENSSSAAAFESSMFMFTDEFRSGNITSAMMFLSRNITFTDTPLLVILPAIGRAKITVQKWNTQSNIKRCLTILLGDWDETDQID